MLNITNTDGGNGGANTGGGGGANGIYLRNAGAGGSGIIVLRTNATSAAFTAGVVVNGTTTSAGQVITPSAQGDGTRIFSITTAASGAKITFS